MNWKDTVKQTHWPLSYEEHLEDIQDQAEITWQAAIKEVVGWITEQLYIDDYGDPCLPENFNELLQSQKKKWGVE